MAVSQRLKACTDERSLAFKGILETIPPTEPCVFLFSRPRLLSLALFAALGGVCLQAAADEENSDRTNSGARLLIPEQSSLPSPSLLDRLLGSDLPRGRLQRPVQRSGDPARALQLAPAQPGLALLCDRAVGGSLGLDRQCLLARLEIEGGELPGYGRGAGLQGAWFIEQAGVDLSFGLSWLSVEQPQRSAGVDTPLIGMPGLFELSPLRLNIPTLEINTRALQLGARLRFGDSGWLKLEGQQLRSSGQTVDLWGQTVPVIDSDALRLSAGYGAFSGALTGRVIELQGQPGTLNSLDLGISWRTPWRGEFSVGATQYWSRGDTRAWPLRELPPAVDESSARVPYVRYQQDL